MLFGLTVKCWLVHNRSCCELRARSVLVGGVLQQPCSTLNAQHCCCLQLTQCCVLYGDVGLTGITHCACIDGGLAFLPLAFVLGWHLGRLACLGVVCWLVHVQCMGLDGTLAEGMQQAVVLALLRHALG